MPVIKICEGQTFHLSPRPVKQRCVNSGILVGLAPLGYTYAVGMRG